ncbi:MAG TPA: hypothetical protein G4O15_02230 [Dehalococcoidia bacterium]|nr:hypothetical protein [Dehalococcoidia bacterium]
MSSKMSKLDNWATNKIKTEYKDDVQLLIGHNSYRLPGDAELAQISFFFPATDKAYALAKTFIIDGIGYDLFPMSWERIERMTELDEDNAPCVGEAEILYYRTEEDKERFLELQKRLKDHLSDSQFVLKKALEKVNVAMELYQTMMFEDELFKVRKAAGHILNYLLNAVAYTNGKYFRTGYMNAKQDLLEMKDIPENLLRLQEDIIKAGATGEIKQLCHELISSTRRYFAGKKGEPEKRWVDQNYTDLAHWYQELSYAWREVYHWCDRDEPVLAFMRGCFLQSELDIVTDEFGLEELDLLGSFNFSDLAAYRKQAEILEKKIISVIEKKGVSIESYDTVKDFLSANQ